MPTYIRAIARLGVMGLLLAGAVVLNSKPAPGLTCQLQCQDHYDNCLHVTCADHSGECAQVCAEIETQCLDSCPK